MRFALVINAAAGTAQGVRELELDILGRFARAGLDAAAVPDHGALPDRVRDAAKMGEVVAIGGGDGSIACAASVLAGTDQPLAILPLGTANMLARDLNIPLDLEQAIAGLAESRVVRIDTAEVNGRLFLNRAMLGFSPILARKREQHRGSTTLATWLALAWSTLRAFSRFRPMTASIGMRQGTMRVRTHAIVVSNNPYDEGFGRVMARSRLDRGTLALYVLTRSSGWALIRILLGMTLGDWQVGKGVDVHATRKAVIASRRRRVHVMLDGEIVMLQSPLRFRIRPASLAVLLPSLGPGTAADPETVVP